MTRLLRWSAILTLIALVLMVWSIIVPTPLPVMVAMTAGQALGTVAFALYVYVVIQDFRRMRAAAARPEPASRDTPEPIAKTSGG